MALEALSSLEALSANELLNFIIYDSISATPFSCNDSSETSSFVLDNDMKPREVLGSGPLSSLSNATARQQPQRRKQETVERKQNLAAVQARKKRRRRPKVCKNKEEAETQRMAHIAVERNRRKQMNEHLAVLRSLMPKSYVPRGDQASIVGGAIEFVKELEHLLQTLEAQKFLILQQGGKGQNETITATSGRKLLPALPFSEFFAYPQYACSQFPNKYTSKAKAAMADTEVTLIETHANIRILSQRRVRQLSKLVVGFQTLHLSILHLNVTTLEPFVLYSISAKVEEGCQLISADDIAAAVHHTLRIIEEDATPSC